MRYLKNLITVFPFAAKMTSTRPRQKAVFTTKRARFLITLLKKRQKNLQIMKIYLPLYLRSAPNNKVKTQNANKTIKLKQTKNKKQP